MARAAIEFKNDISRVIPVIAAAVENSALSPDSDIAGFRYGEMRIVIDRNRMQIYGTEDRGTVENIIAWMSGIVRDAAGGYIDGKTES